MTAFDFYLCQGTSYNVNLDLTDCNNLPINLNGYAISGYAKTSYGSTGVLINLNPTITSANSGIISIAVTPQQTQGLPVSIFPYDIEMSNGTQTLKVLRGLVYLSPEVTF